MDILKGVLMILLTVVMYKLAQILQRKYNNPLLESSINRFTWNNYCFTFNYVKTITIT